MRLAEANITKEAIIDCFRKCLLTGIHPSSFLSIHRINGVREFDAILEAAQAA
jgi:hypothetical protein